MFAFCNLICSNGHGKIFIFRVNNGFGKIMNNLCMNYEVPVKNGTMIGNRNSMAIEVRISFEKETRKVNHF